MAGRSPARFLAPLALVVVAVALYMVVTSNLSSDETESDAPNQATENRATSSPDGEDEDEPKKRLGPRRYTVKAGDTPSAIAEKTGIPLTTILRLNPDLDPQTLSPGQTIRLRQ